MKINFQSWALHWCLAPNLNLNILLTLSEFNFQFVHLWKGGHYLKEAFNGVRMRTHVFWHLLPMIFYWQCAAWHIILIANIFNEIKVNGAKARTPALESSDFTKSYFLISGGVLELLHYRCSSEVLKSDYCIQDSLCVDMCDAPRRNLNPWAVWKWFLKVQHVTSRIGFYGFEFHLYH